MPSEQEPSPFQWNKEQLAGKYHTPERSWGPLVDYANGDVRMPSLLPRNAKEQAELDKEIAEIRESMLDRYQRGF